MIDYKKLKLKCGLEIHVQLATKHKLFCKCPTTLAEKEFIKTIKRKLHVVASELGEIDRAAQFEYLRNRTFYYRVFANESCLVEADEEPPHEVNEEALQVALQVAMLLNCKIPHEIHVMRKTVIDGSNTSGFQRTMIVGMDGYVEYKGKKVPIATVCLEEDAASIEKEEDGKVYYKLNRLGIPLIEISTGTLEGFTPQEVQEIAEKIGMIVKSTKKARRGIGSIRQDVNVSIARGARVEIKGVQELEMLAKVIENEVKRQLELIEKGIKVEEETRAANPDGTTRFMRPLPGAARMYPETDIPPISIDEKMLRKIKANLPETLDKKVEKFVKLGLSSDLALQLVKSDWLELAEEIVAKGIEAKLVARILVTFMKNLKRSGFDVSRISENALKQLFEFYRKGRITKEGIEEVLKFVCQEEGSLEEIIDRHKLWAMSKEEIEKVVKQIIKENEGLPKNKLFGIVMGKLRGKARVEDVKEVFEKLS